MSDVMVSFRDSWVVNVDDPQDAPLAAAKLIVQALSDPELGRPVPVRLKHESAAGGWVDGEDVIFIDGEWRRG